MVFTTKIRIPELIIERIRVGNNKVLHLAENEEILEVQVKPHKERTYILKDKIGREFYLKLSKSNYKTKNKNILKVKIYQKFKN